MIGLRRGLILSVGGFIGLAAGAWAQAPLCQSCHPNVHVTSPAHRDLACTDCHSNVTKVPHPPKVLKQLGGDALCQQCHDDVVPQVAASVHGPEACTDCHGPAHEIPPPRWTVCGDCHAEATEAFQASAHQKSLNCSSCHESVHTLRPSKQPGSRVHPFQQIQTCGSCHTKPPQLIDGYLQSVHGRGLLLAGLVTAPACSDCHGSHGIFRVQDVRSMVSARNAPLTCGRCHAGVLDVWSKESTHGYLWREGRTGGPVCTTCHGSHQIQEPRAGVQRLKFPETCGGCHGERYHTYRDGFHGQATGLGFLTAATCSDCHTPHQDQPAQNPKSSVHPANLIQTCGRCHGPVTAAFVTFDPHADPRDPQRNRPVYYVWFFMTSLLVFVFGFFGIHTLLWLQRSIVGALRGEFHPIRRWKDETVWIR
ncbi:MAG: cytochrome c3 family protein, partial [Acidobacteria bacterium]|nr:cytochrome c3 family protein [Acidobacteriota bacterium]MDW7984888.1 cytochrome c3 family protein [Acidobacteriota bacterium]